MEPDSRSINGMHVQVKCVMKCDAYPCKMCKTYIQCVGFIN